MDVSLVHARHGKAGPGHTTDARASAWVADRLRHGLLTASCMPPRPSRDRRALTRYRSSGLRAPSAVAHRRVKRRGKQQALIAVAPRMLVLVYHMWSRRMHYGERGEEVCKPRSVQAQSQRLIRQLEALGCRGTVAGRKEAA
jgi:hypothetical protein